MTPASHRAMLNCLKGRRHHLETSANDWIMYSERPSNDSRFPFGTVDYPREPPEEEVRALVIIPLGQVVTAG